MKSMFKGALLGIFKAHNDTLQRNQVTVSFSCY